MGPAADVAVKKRKVIYDDYTGGFYAESRVESLQRMCDYRARLTDVINKAEEAKYRFACKQVEAEKNLFLMKKEKAANKHAETLQEHKAHMNVLDKLAKDRQYSAPVESDNYGKYPPDSLRKNIDELIEKELKEMSPVVKRRREATRLLLKRTGMIEADRTLSTDEMFADLKKRKSRVNSPVKTPVKTPEVRRSAPQLILPAISVRMNRNGDGTKITDSVTLGKSSLNKEKTKPSDDAVLPPVFVTDLKGYLTPI